MFLKSRHRYILILSVLVFVILYFLKAKKTLPFANLFPFFGGAHSRSERCLKKIYDKITVTPLRQCQVLGERLQTLVNLKNLTETVLISAEPEQNWGEKLQEYLTSFYFALETQKTIQLLQESEEPFSSCGMNDTEESWRLISERFRDQQPCVSTKNSCSSLFTCQSHQFYTVRTDSLCVSENFCKDMKNNKFLVGCGLRSLLEPSEKVLKSEIEVFSKGKIEVRTLNDFQKMLTSKFVITLYLESDNLAATESDIYRALDIMIRCAETVKSYKYQREQKLWYLSTNSVLIRKIAQKYFEGEIIMLELHSDDQYKGLIQFIDWYLLGFGRELIQNTVLPKETLSDFALSAFAYQFKDAVYSSDKCQAYSLEDDIIWNSLKWPCAYHPVTKLSQDHLKLLSKIGLTFPTAWVKNGKVQDHRPFPERVSVEVAPPAKRAPGTAKNVLLIIADDWRSTPVSLSGKSFTPNIDNFRKKAVQFEYAFCNVPLCGPSRASFLRGREPPKSQIISNHFRIEDYHETSETLPEFLKNRGWNTYSVGKVFQLNDPQVFSERSWTKVTLPSLMESQSHGYLMQNCVGRTEKDVSWKDFRLGRHKLISHPGKELYDILTI